jgi:hypothetical protein
MFDQVSANLCINLDLGILQTHLGEENVGIH